jgi:hypothetical protein
LNDFLFSFFSFSSFFLSLSLSPSNQKSHPLSNYRHIFRFALEFKTATAAFKGTMASNPLDSFRQDRPLAESIAIATRGIHARLNKLIISRLPLALPPHADDSLVYASGLLHIAPIYTTFESLWRDIILEPVKDGQEDAASEPKYCRTMVSDELRETLVVLYAEGLARADRLIVDLQSMTGWTEAATREQLALVSRTGHLAEVISHIRRAINNKPHVLLAYSYIMYMALFAGGRFIRATLESAGKDFWGKTGCGEVPMPRQYDHRDIFGTVGKEPEQQPDNAFRSSHGSAPLRFFHFDTPQDGEDLKRNFKQTLADREGILSYQEKHDVVQEAICIFENMVLVVAQLDHVMVSRPEVEPCADSLESVNSATTVIKWPMLHPRFRDSVVVTRERNARSSSNRASSMSKSASGSESESDSKPADKQTPTGGTTEKYPPTEPDNHPTIPSVTGVETCPGLPKSMRFETSLPHPSRGHFGGGSGDSTADMADSLKMASTGVSQDQVINWVFGVAIGVILLGAVFSGRRAASLE